jgi:malate synthase
MTAQPLRFEPEFPRGPRHPVSVASSPSGSEPSGSKPSGSKPSGADAATARRVDVRHPVGRAAPGGSGVVLTPEALAFVADLVDHFGPAVRELLAARADRRERLERGEDRLDFLPETQSIRDAEWTVAPAPTDLRRRVVEITAPVDRKMMINALNSGADVFMADFEDACSPTWENIIDGQVNLRDAVRGTIALEDPVTGKSYRLAPKRATLVVRPRGLHLMEHHLLLDGRPVPAALVDFGLYFFHNAHALVERGTGPYFYLPKLESHREARFWNTVFRHAQDTLGIPHGTIRATVLIETLPAAFEMDEILWELREHASGLNCGRWDYIFSSIKMRRHDPGAVFPDRAAVTMTQPNMRAYTQLVVRTCHRRDAFAIGGMAAQIPVRDDALANAAALEKVAADKQREAGDGHDGTWVAHPALVLVARDAFAAGMTGDDQRHVRREDVHVTAQDLLGIPTGPRTEDGLRLNIRVGIRYLAAWLGGAGAVPLYNLMEDVATAEISRAQLWQWLRHGARLDDGREVCPRLVAAMIEDEVTAIRRDVGEDAFQTGHFDDACEIFSSLTLDYDLREFLTVVAYDRLD